MRRMNEQTSPQSQGRETCGHEQIKDAERKDARRRKIVYKAGA